MQDREYRRLHAEWYELASARHDHTEEIDVLARRIREAGEPALELGVGTGRVLVPLRERGLDVSGLDTSRPMLDRCRAALDARGLTAELHEQSMLDLDLSRTYRTIVLVSGGLGLFTADEVLLRLFDRVMAHLEPGGQFVCEFEPVTSARGMEEDRGWTGDWLTAPDDVVIAWRNRNRYDAATHVWERLFVIEKYVGGRLVETEANERTGRFFLVEEVLRYADAAGFVRTVATDWLTEDPPGDDSTVVTVRCRKP